MNKPAIRKTCPHCDSLLETDDLACPACGKPYWQPEVPSPVESKEQDEEDTLGCFSILLWPLLISIGVTAALILLGFVFQVFVNFETNQLKAAWILGSAAAGGLVYVLIIKLRKNK